MSTKFRPNQRTRRPPPQCKKAEPVPDSPKPSEPPGSLAGQMLLVDWNWREIAPIPVFNYSHQSYERVDFVNTIITIDRIDANNYAEVVWHWDWSAQLWIVTCDLFYAGIFWATTGNVSISYDGGTPFGIGPYNYPVVPVAGTTATMLTITVTS